MSFQVKAKNVLIKQSFYMVTFSNKKFSEEVQPAHRETTCFSSQSKKLANDAVNINLNCKFLRTWAAAVRGTWSVAVYVVVITIGSLWISNTNGNINTNVKTIQNQQSMTSFE